MNSPPTQRNLAAEAINRLTQLIDENTHFICYGCGLASVVCAESTPFFHTLLASVPLWIESADPFFGNERERIIAVNGKVLNIASILAAYAAHNNEKSLSELYLKSSLYRHVVTIRANSNIREVHSDVGGMLDVRLKERICGEVAGWRLIRDLIRLYQCSV